MKKCPVCGKFIQEWETLCSDCWRLLELLKKHSKKEELIAEKLKGRAKAYLTDLLREICKHCPNRDKDFKEDICQSCRFYQKERLIRVFLD